MASGDWQDEETSQWLEGSLSVKRGSSNSNKGNFGKYSHPLSIPFGHAWIRVQGYGEIVEGFLVERGRGRQSMHLVAWNNVCFPKEKGADLRNLEAMKKALLCIWSWNFDQEECNLWRKVVATKFGLEDGWDIMLHQGPFGRSPWRGIVQF